MNEEKLNQIINKESIVDSEEELWWLLDNGYDDLSYVSNRLRNDYEIMKKVCYKIPYLYEDVNDKFKDDKLFLIDVLNNYEVVEPQIIFLEHASEKLKSDREVVGLAIENDYLNDCLCYIDKDQREIYYANPILLEDEEFVKEHAKNCPYLFEYISDEMKDKLFLFLIDEVGIYSRAYVTENFYKNKEMVLKVLYKTPCDCIYHTIDNGIYDALNEQMQLDYDIIRKAAKYTSWGICLDKVINELDDIDFLVELIEINFKVYLYINDKYKNHEKILKVKPDEHTLRMYENFCNGY